MSDHEHEHEISAEIQPRPYSIDLTLELERQLDNESIPPSSPGAIDRPQSLDPHVLASIITQLRTSLADATRERDDLAQTLAETRSREAGLADTLNHMTEKYTKLQEEFDGAKTKIKDDEDAIAMLRTKVEESRRGLMRLQSESRRMSQVPSGIDMSRAGLPSLGAPPSSKRSSFAPLTGSAAGRVNSHRRISSVATVSDASFSLMDGGTHLTSPNPHTPSFTFPDAASLKNSRRMSGMSSMFARGSPPQSLHTSEESAELENLRHDLNAMRVELDIAKHELGESNEAKEASEMCVKALREFIAENNVGVQPPPPPPKLPSLSMTSSSQSENKSAAAGGWGFKLWRADTTVKSPAATSLPASMPVPAVSAAPLTKKLGGFFTSRGSVSSVTSPVSRPVEQEPMYNGMSDVSSIEDSLVEPVSPSSELSRPNVMVRDDSTTSSRDLGSPEQIKAQHLASPLAMESALPPLVA
ncbi:hypothetical protein BJ138DRAFT_1079184 [Hygrophoropsis aurantiaca]|uniref:Uncharacterized protein n=1 Tax=Hygrophoropsis aurantiaca TaxID=72124 RepID=A0ACB8AN74_9AGAM|nr:hypothetical protein BJ138DRAFT_1079184 [Hygrophoropsis aurantiaca]